MHGMNTLEFLDIITGSPEVTLFLGIHHNSTRHTVY